MTSRARPTSTSHRTLPPVSGSPPSDAEADAPSTPVRSVEAGLPLLVAEPGAPVAPGPPDATVESTAEVVLVPDAVDPLAEVVVPVPAVVLLPLFVVLLPAAVVLLPAAVVLLPAAVVLLPGAVVLVPGAVVLVPGAVVLLPGAVVFAPAAVVAGAGVVATGVAVVAGAIVVVGSGAVVLQPGFVNVLLFNETWPVLARARPLTDAPALTVIEVEARIVPTNADEVPNVAELPTCHTTLQACAPFVSTTWLAEDVMSVDAIWKMKIALGSPCASSVRVPPNASELVDV
jgi:hypothetical protein